MSLITFSNVSKKIDQKEKNVEKLFFAVFSQNTEIKNIEKVKIERQNAQKAKMSN